MRLADLIATYRPESWGGTRGHTWPEHAHYLWVEDAEYMRNMAEHMTRVGWFHGPVTVDDGVVQNGHHRIVIATGLGWYDRAIPVAEG